MRVLGVDVSLGRGLDVVLLEDTMVKEKWNRTGPRALTELLWTHRPDAVAIDAPPKVGLGLLRDDTERARLPVPPPSGKHLAKRAMPSTSAQGAPGGWRWRCFRTPRT